MLSSVLLATDGSPAAKAATAFVRDLASAIPSLAVTVLNVQTIPHPFTVDYMPPDSYGRLEEESREILREAADILAEATVGVETLSVQGDPATEIIKAAKGHDLVVVGSRGLNPMGQIFLGSVSDRVARFAPSAVTVIHA